MSIAPRPTDAPERPTTDAVLERVRDRLEADDTDGALTELTRALADEPTSPRRAWWLFEQGQLERALRGPTPEALASLRGAVEACGSAGDQVENAQAAGDGGPLAESLLALGETLLDLDAGSGAANAFELLHESIRSHQRAERLFRERGERTSAALCQINTAVAYLSMGSGPSSLKPKIAIQCLRAALADLDRDDHPELWASAAMNLANALQQLPPEADAANLVEAVAIYGELLTLRDAASDPHGFGRVAANLGAALAKLGQFDRAESLLAEARAAFATDAEAVEGVNATLEAIAEARAKAGAAPSPAPGAAR